MSAFVRKIQSEYLNMESPLDAEGFDWDRSRGGDFRCITQALYVIAKYPSSLSMGAITQLEKWLHNPTVKPYARSKGKKMDTDPNEDLSRDDAFLERIHATFRTFSKLVGDASLRPSFLKPEWRVSPIEFVMMCLLISVNKDNMTMQELAVKVGEMRVRVRAEHLDIRLNSRVAKTMFDFIKGSSGSPQMSDPAGGVKRKREEEEVVISGRKEKELKEDTGCSAPARSQPLPILLPPRPDRLLAVREAKKIITPPRMTPPKINIPTAPAALR